MVVEIQAKGAWQNLDPLSRFGIRAAQEW